MITLDKSDSIEMIQWNEDEAYKQSIDYQRMGNQFDLMFADIENMELGQAKFPQQGHSLTYPIGYNANGSYRK